MKPGEQIEERFRVVDLISQGGSGSVYRAQDLRLGRDVALKILRSGGAASEKERMRFLQEVRALARLSHPNIVPIHSTGFHRGAPYLAMKWVEGTTLADRLVSQRFTKQEALRILLDLTDAVQHAHEQGILHRDLKPSNVLIDRNEQVFLTDFGLARDMDDSLSGTRLTASGRFLGTPGFWPPEQARGQVDAFGPPSDVYGLGAVLYALLTRQPPVLGDSLLEILARIEVPVEPPSAFAPGVDPAVEAVCMRCLEIQMKDRYPSAAALRVDLERCAAAADAGAARPRGPVLGALAGFGGLVLAGALAVALAWPSSQPEPTDEGTPETPVLPAEPATAQDRPAWYDALPAPERPGLPLPAGLTFLPKANRYLNERDGSRLAYVGEGLFLGVREVSQVEYGMFCRHTDYPFYASPAGVADGDPKTFISWLDAMAYCRWAGVELPLADDWQRAFRFSLARFGRADPLTLSLVDRTAEWARGEPLPGEEPRERPVLGGSFTSPPPRRGLWLWESGEPDVGFRVSRRVGAPVLPPPPRLRWSVRTAALDTEGPGSARSRLPTYDQLSIATEGSTAVVVKPRLDLRFRNGGPDGVGLPAALDNRFGAVGKPAPARDHFGVVAECRARLKKGRWMLWLVCDDGARVLVDGVPVIVDWAYGHSRLTAGAFELQKTREVELRVEYFELNGAAELRLELFPME